jgi:hypothetical protein
VITMQTIFSFLGVDNKYVIEKTELKNTSKTGKVKQLGPVLRKSKMLFKNVSALLPQSLKDKIVDTMFTKTSAEGSKVKLTDDDRKFAYQFFKDDIDELETMLNLDLSNWKYK